MEFGAYFGRMLRKKQGVPKARRSPEKSPNCAAVKRDNASSVARVKGIVDSVLARWKRQIQHHHYQSGISFPGSY